MSCSTVYGGLATTMKFDLYKISILLILNKPIVFIAPQIVPCVYITDMGKVIFPSVSSRYLADDHLFSAQ